MVLYLYEALLLSKSAAGNVNPSCGGWVDKWEEGYCCVVDQDDWTLNVIVFVQYQNVYLNLSYPSI